MVNNYFEYIGNNKIIKVGSNQQLLKILDSCYERNIGVRVIGSGWNFNFSTISE